MDYIENISVSNYLKDLKYLYEHMSPKKSSLIVGWLCV